MSRGGKLTPIITIVIAKETGINVEVIWLQSGHVEFVISLEEIEEAERTARSGE